MPQYSTPSLVSATVASGCNRLNDEEKINPLDLLSVADTLKMSAYPYENRKIQKIARRRGTIDEKREKEAFVGVRRAKNGES